MIIALKPVTTQWMENIPQVKYIPDGFRSAEDTTELSNF